MPAARPKTTAPGTQQPHRVVPPSRSGGHGRRLTEAFDALEHFPALSESRERVLRVASAEAPAAPDLVEAVQSDLALVVSVMRFANARPEMSGKVATVPEAIEVLTPAGVEAMAQALETFDLLDPDHVWDFQPERFRVHAIATQRAAARIATELELRDHDQLIVSTLLHDVGKLVLAHAYAGYPAEIHGAARTPEQRLHAERRELGVDHALVGGVLVRRWGLPKALATTVERHHADDAEDAAAIVRLADMLAHYLEGEPVAPEQLLSAARATGLTPNQLRGVMYDLPLGIGGRRPAPSQPCPLSNRELQVLKRLGEGKVYKQIALELSLSTSTIRTHLHNIYVKIGAIDRAQAVLMAAERGWL
jgi:putative nucleotidyltransferase with HDIG domain